MNQKIMNQVIKQIKFDYRHDVLFKMLGGVTNDGFYINRAIQLLKEAEYDNVNKESRIAEVMKLLLVRQCNRADQMNPIRKILNHAPKNHT